MNRPCLLCGRLTTGAPRHVECARAYDRARRPSPTQRYGPGYQARHRAVWQGQTCTLGLPGCTGAATTADHGPHGLRPACHHCNSADGASRSHTGMASWHGRELIVLMGPPGSGKSTYARRYPYVVTTDALRSGLVPVEQVYTAAFDAVVAGLKANRSVVLDTPASTIIVRRRALRVASSYRASARLIVFTTPADECVARQQGRQHPVPESVVRRMHEQIAVQRQDVTREGWASVVEVGGTPGT